MRLISRKKISIIMVLSILLSITTPWIGLRDVANDFSNTVFAGNFEYDVSEPHVIINQVY